MRQLPLDADMYILVPILRQQCYQLKVKPSTLLHPPTKPLIIMRFSAALLALAASASAVAVPRAGGDYWDVSVSTYDDANLSTTVTAHFHSEANPDDSRFGSRFTCIIDDKPTPNWCDHNGVSADWDGKSKSQY
jgi:hypothetical protein